MENICNIDFLIQAGDNVMEDDKMKSKVVLFFSSIVFIMLSLSVTGCSWKQVGYGLGALERTGR